MAFKHVLIPFNNSPFVPSAHSSTSRRVLIWLIVDYSIPKMASKSDKSPSKTNGPARRAEPSDGEQELFVSVAGGLLGSSCCLIQLTLNLLAEFGVMTPIGCAGFNKLLGPLRHYLRFGTLLYFIYKWLYGKTCCSKRKLVTYAILCSSLMFMPEALRVMSRMNSSSSRLAAIAPSTTNVEKLVFTVDNMGCEACETHVKRIVESFDGVVWVENVDYETGLMHLTVNREWNFDEDRLDAKLEENGYDLLPEASTTKKMKWESETASASVFVGGDL